MSLVAPEAERAAWADRASLLTPVAKAFATDAAIAVTSAGIQVHGGAGYIEETGAAQHYPRCPRLRHLRGHQRHPGDRPRHPQAEARRRRAGRRGHQRDRRDRRRSRQDQPAGIRPGRRRGWPRPASISPRRPRSSPRRWPPATRACSRCWRGRRPMPGFSALHSAVRFWQRARSGPTTTNRDRAIALARFLGESLLGEAASLAAAVIGGGGRPAAGRDRTSASVSRRRDGRCSRGGRE